VSVRSSVALVIPVRGGDQAKSRLDVIPERRAALAAAFALDTLAAAQAASRVGVIVVVGALPEQVEGITVVPDPGQGLLPAVRAGLQEVARTAPGSPAAVLLGDLPALRPEELDRALATAQAHERAFVPDADGSGTTLLVARAGVRHDLGFGADSAAHHRAAGYTEVELPERSGLRCDVDTIEQLRAAALLPLGPRTRALLIDDLARVASGPRTHLRDRE
jgi:2-phospho-L-lactate/phosphoenolpyruvate guanylyltransferase